MNLRVLHNIFVHHILSKVFSQIATSCLFDWAIHPSWEKLEFISYVPQMFVGLFIYLFFFKVGSVCVCVYIYIYIYTHTVGTESIQTPLNFSLFVILQPFAKII